MLLTESAVIERLFANAIPQRPDVVLGYGDDAALLSPPPGQWIVAATDTLVAERHFFPETDPSDIAYKALAVNLSDFAAMGAKPAWVLLALTLPQANESWLRAFSQGFANGLQRFGLQLVGGDTTQGPLTITVQLLGWVSPGHALRRNGAKPGDEIYVTGHLGDAGLALQWLRQRRLGKTLALPPHYQPLLERLQRPEPRLATGLALLGLASSAIDISDGLVADLGHVLTASQVGASLELDKLPLSPALQQLSCEQAWSLALSAGDDYELCFTIPPQYQSSQLRKTLASIDCPYTCVGHIETEPGLRLRNRDNKPFFPAQRGFEHFREAGLL